jgi:uncharacterized membrane protein
MKKIKKPKNLLQTALLGGFGAVLPTVMLVILFQWIIRLIEKYLKPLVDLFQVDSRVWNIAIYILGVLAILLLFFLIGLIIKTRLGNMIRNYLERVFLLKLPGYKTMKDVVMQFIDSRNSFFREVVLVDVFGNGTLMTGFITDNQGEYVTVFVPTGPNPTSGNILHVPKSRIIPSNVAVETAVKSIISCGAGSADVFVGAGMGSSSFLSSKDHVDKIQGVENQ